MYQLMNDIKIQEDFDNLLKEQNNLCAICRQTEITIDGNTKKVKTLSIDHCHETGKIRKLLCNNCNQGLGKFKHNTVFLREAANYLEKYK